MQFRDLRTQYYKLKEKIDLEINQVLQDANYISGYQVEELERKLSDYVGVKNCVTCANGTDALLLALMVWNIGEGDAVFVPDFTFFSTGEVVAARGATPVFVDVNKDTFNMEPKELEKAIIEVKREGKLIPKVVVPVDLFGLPADYEQISVIAKKYDLLVLEDGAQGFGGRIGEKRCCSFGDISTTSFFPAKPLGCYGDGGAVFTNNDEWANLLKSYRVHGKGSSKYDNIRIGLNSRLDTLQAAILKVKLKAFEEYELESVNKVARKYTKLLENVVKVPVIPINFKSSWAQYTIQLKTREQRDGLKIYLEDKKIPAMIYYSKPMHLQKAFRNVEDYSSSFRNTVELCDTVLSLPMHPYISDEDIVEICMAIKAYVEEQQK